MNKRIQINEVEPKAFNTLFKLEEYLQQGELSKIHKELIKIRASQINGCAFCIDMHVKEAIQLGEDPHRIHMLTSWKDSNLFTEDEKVILQVTEEITWIHQNGLTDKTYQEAILLLDENYLSQVIMAIVTINAWNRIAISTKKPIEG